MADGAYDLDLNRWSALVSANNERNSIITNKRVQGLQGTSSYLKGTFDIDPGCLIGAWRTLIVIDRVSMGCPNTHHRRSCFCGEPNTRRTLLNGLIE
ncbi:hypothetical protein T265_07744 [Opisthorchis viverrini]|uniref:Uncharacterized protein n=1 Tax=Opisthorchis viverrini TaxID=6198 RepID=A0A074ZC00_OPIVI|nr:hypothetical protein T265_07744 [Opisthorchis viverrini]KER24648.1 hypothetical protein T265_07744 [Opisthorchis viverrini]